MTKIQLFKKKVYQLEDFQKEVNEFLKTNDGKIVVRDIKYTCENTGASSNDWALWSVMIWYDEV